MKCFLDTINEKYGSDKLKWNAIYDELLGPRRFEIKDVLEIGIYHGQSIMMWLDYFPNAKVYGIDNNSLGDRCVEKYVDPLVGPRFEYWIGDGAEKAFLARVIGGKTFDLVIDDASHKVVDQIASFAFFRDKIKPGGYYVCEDIPLVQNLLEWWPSFSAGHLTYKGLRRANGSPEMMAIFKREQ